MANLGTRSTASPIWTATFGTTSPVTGSAPTDSTDGLPTNDLSQVTVILSAPAAQTLSGAGTVTFYEYSVNLSRWILIPSLTISVTATGVRDIEVGTYQVAPFSVNQGSNALACVPVGITFSGGSTGVTITLVGTKAVMASRGIGF